MKISQILLVIAISSGTAMGSLALYRMMDKKRETVNTGAAKQLPVLYARYSDGDDITGPVDFTRAASSAVPAVVHIKTKTLARKASGKNQNINDFLNQMIGPGYDASLIPEQRVTGSGVLISEDGYILTNNHVLTDDSGEVAAEINVTLYNGKTYTAKLVGRNSNTDIAVLKIESAHLPHLVFGNSDDLKTGQWVLAVGYPFSLEATVTAGIISATCSATNLTGRRVRNEVTPAPSMIQTDAALNIGNSGGALINTGGELIGITTGIVSPTGTYSGYSFAIPVNAVKQAVKEVLQAQKKAREN